MLTQLTNALTAFITNLYVSTGLLGIVIAMAIESCCIPLPSELVMPIAGIMIASGRILQGTNSFVALVLVALAGAVGCLLGSFAAYWIGYAGGRPLMLKYGRYLLISQHDADKADQFFQKWGSATAFFSRLLPVIRTYISLPAGISKMPFAKFCIYTVLGSFPWCLLLAYVGTILGNHLETLSPIFHSLDVVIVVAIVLLVALYIWRHIRNDRLARAALVSAEAAPMKASAPLLQNQQSWGQPPSTTQQPNWNQPSPQPQQGWSQQPQSPQQPNWSSPVQSPQPSWPQQGQSLQGWSSQPPQPEQKSQQQQFRPQPLQPSQQGWSQPSPSQPQQNNDNDRTIRRN